MYINLAVVFLGRGNPVEFDTVVAMASLCPAIKKRPVNHEPFFYSKKIFYKLSTCASNTVCVAVGKAESRS